jgi:hypothetical protein
MPLAARRKIPMPNAELILASLSGIATHHWYVAAAWHVVIGIFLAATSLGWRPSRPVMAVLLTAPLASVALFALLDRSWFNAAMFGLLTSVLPLVGVRPGVDPVRRARTWEMVAGALMIAYAWFYPHFLPPGLALAALYAAPVGLLPCPTLALVIGSTLAFGGFGSRWTLVLVVAGLFYGLFGTLRLRVGLDLGLIAGALALAVTLRTRGSPAPALLRSAS